MAYAYLPGPPGRLKILATFPEAVGGSRKNLFYCLSAFLNGGTVSIVFSNCKRNLPV